MDLHIKIANKAGKLYIRHGHIVHCFLSESTCSLILNGMELQGYNIRGAASTETLEMLFVLPLQDDKNFHMYIYA